ncbi:MAG TPA: hypothetical protein VF310_03990, partial [Vicinamibacteria bacterium]
MPPLRRAMLLLVLLLPAKLAHASLLEPQADAGFGRAVAVSGETMVVGAPTCRGANGQINEGAVWVYTRDGAGWALQQRIANPRSVGDNFGTSVAIAGDVLAVGAPGDSVGFNTGIVYVFARSGASWALQQRLIAGSSVDMAGWSVALSGDTLAVGGFAPLVTVFV